jgi:uncharacterized caspase-like protein
MKSKWRTNVGTDVDTNEAHDSRTYASSGLGIAHGHRTIPVLSSVPRLLCAAALQPQRIGPDERPRISVRMYRTTMK